MGSLASEFETSLSLEGPNSLNPLQKNMSMSYMNNMQTPPQGIEDNFWSQKRKRKNRRHKNQVHLEAYIEGSEQQMQHQNDNNEVSSSSSSSSLSSSSTLKTFSRTKSLTDDDLDELKGCLDLGFGFNYDEIPELCNTLPALELCYSMSQRFLDEQNRSPESSPATSATGEACVSPFANWKISSPGDHPEDVKARLKFWAQAVACTVRLCS